MALDTCVESQSVDFKESAPWEALQFKIIRTAMAMANLRDGGVIVIGVGERGEQWELTGISNEHVATYDVDDVADAINKYASPSVIATIVITAHNDHRYLVIRVPEFVETPIVCRRAGDAKSGLKPGVVYVRPPGKAQTTEVTTAEQMHDLLELAAEKRARRILETAARIGLVAQPANKPFDDELGGL